MKFTDNVKIFLLIILSMNLAVDADDDNIKGQKWVGTWYTAPQLVEPYNNPPSPGLSNNTIRQIVRVSIGGEVLRVRFTNEFSSSPLVMNSVNIAISKGSGSIDSLTSTPLTFNGSTSITIPAGKAVASDPVNFSLKPLTDVAITIYFGQVPADITGHPGSRTTSYILQGNQVSKKDFNGSVTTDHWYIIQGIEVLATDSTYAIVTLGNSITDGRGSGTNKQNRWPDILSQRLQSDSLLKNTAVLNAGIGGNCVLRQCLGPSALSRFERDVLNQYGVRWLIILEGINDIGGSQGTGIADNLIEAYKQMITLAHSKGIYVYGATLLPMKGNSYYNEIREAERQKVNQWIRTSGYFDGVTDFDKALRNPADTLSLLPEADTGDHLHPNENGHKMMGEAVDLKLFLRRDSLVFNDSSWKKFFEAECGNVGNNWDILDDAQASNGKYVIVKNGLQSLSQAPAGEENIITISFNVDSTDLYYLYARLNCPTANDDSYWIKIDNENFQMYNGLGTSSWEWKRINSYRLEKGDHTLTIAYREDGAKLDKICITNYDIAPLDLGEEAVNLCNPTDIGEYQEKTNDYVLRQNFPNPFNSSTQISFSIPVSERVQLKIYDILGRLVSTVVDEIKRPGMHNVEFRAFNLSSGIYLYKLNTERFSETKKFVLMK